MNLRSKKQKFAYWFLIIATFFMYIMLTSSKNLYVAEKTTMINCGFNSIALATTMEYYFYTYALMQILLAFFIKKINVKWYLAITVTLSAILTILISTTSKIENHVIIYIINGVMQAGIWGCSIKTLSNHLPTNLLPKGTALMSSGPAVAYFISYGTASTFGENWKTPFVFLGILLIIAVILFVLAVNLASKYPRVIELHHVVRADGSEEDVSSEVDNDFIHLKNKKRVAVFYAFSIFLGLIVTFFYFSLNNNIDYYLNKVGCYNNTTSKLISMVVLVLQVIGPIIIVRLCEKYTNFLKVGLVTFSLSLICTLALLLLSIFKVKTFIIPLIIYSLFLILVNGGRTISLSISALKMRDRIDSGVYSTLINVAASISAGFAPKIYTVIINPEETNLILITKNWINAFVVSTIIGTIIVVTLIVLILWIKKLNKKDEVTDKVLSDTIISK